MIYNEQQLEKFSKPLFKYERDQVIATHKSIREAIDSTYDREVVKSKYGLGDSPEVEFFLQGSYGNDTNISKSSDVDIVVLMRNIWRSDLSNLSAETQAKYHEAYSSVSYPFETYSADILACLTPHFGWQYLHWDEKCIRLRNHPKYCDADIVPAFSFRLYGTFDSKDKQTFTPGIYFDTKAGKRIINFPKTHAEGLANKSAETNGNFKETVRMFKTLRNELIDHNKISHKTAKSYYIENLLYNIPNSYFAGTYSERYKGICEKLIIDFNNKKMAAYQCANGVNPLFSDGTWSLDLSKDFLLGLQFIRDNNQY